MPLIPFLKGLIKKEALPEFSEFWQSKLTLDGHGEQVGKVVQAQTNAAKAMEECLQYASKLTRDKTIKQWADSNPEFKGVIKNAFDLDNAFVAELKTLIKQTGQKFRIPDLFKEFPRHILTCIAAIGVFSLLSLTKKSDAA